MRMKPRARTKAKLKLMHIIHSNFLRLNNSILLLNLFVKSLKNPRNKTLQILKGTTFVGDGIITSHDISILGRAEQSFQVSMEGLPIPVIMNYSAIQWRVHICTWAASQVQDVEGDFIDCGVWYGALPKTICDFVDIDTTGRKYFLVDSWGSDKSVQNESKYSEDIYDLVKQRFSGYNSVELIRGLVPGALPQVSTRKVAFLALDMNGWEAELHALEYFYPILSKGAVVYLDDYGWDYPELRMAVTTFLQNKPEELLVFPTGNAIFIKK